MAAEAAGEVIRDLRVGVPSVLFLLMLGACDPGSIPSVASVRDSAGVTLVENHPGEGPLAYIARLDSSYLRIGVLEGDPAYIFSSVVGLRGLDGGGVLVAESQARELRVYDASGSHVRTFGGRGDGPGEFASLSGLVGLSGDTVWAWDSRSRRLTSYLTSGELIGTVTSAGDPGGRIRELHRLSDGTYVALSRWGSGLTSSRESQDLAVVRDTIVLRRLDATLQELDTIAVLPSSESLRESQITSRNQTAANGEIRTVMSGSIRQTERPFGRTSYYHPRLPGVVTATNDSYEWIVRALDGSVRLISRVPDFNRPISTGRVTELRDWFLSNGTSPERMREAFEDFPLPDLAPAFGPIRVDPRGRVWLAEYKAVPNTASIWIVFSPDGQLLGQVEVPPGLEVHEIGDDYLLGVQRDEFDVPYVLRFRLVEI